MMKSILFLFVFNFQFVMAQTSKQTITIYGVDYATYYSSSSKENIQCNPKIVLKHYVEYPFMIVIECSGLLDEVIHINTTQAKVTDTDSMMIYTNNGEFQDQLILYRNNIGEFYRAEYIPFATDWMFDFLINKIYLKDE